MMTIHEEYLIDSVGNRKAVVLPVSEWQKIKEELNELDDIRAYDEAKCHLSNPIPFEQAMLQIYAGQVD
jgi:PHD/YefM family antitoxin component YafN of YafNO toxin-antitoxin module